MYRYPRHPDKVTSREASHLKPTHLVALLAHTSCFVIIIIYFYIQSVS